MRYSDRHASPKPSSGRSAPVGDGNSDLMSAREKLMSSRFCLDTLGAQVSKWNPSWIKEFGSRWWAVRLRFCQKDPHASASTPCRTLLLAEDRWSLDHPIESKAPLGGRPAQVSVRSLLPLACACRASSRILSSVRTRREI